MVFYGVVYNMEGKSPRQWADDFNKTWQSRIKVIAEPRANCVVLFKEKVSNEFRNLERTTQSGKGKAWRQ